MKKFKPALKCYKQNGFPCALFGLCYAGHKAICEIQGKTRSLTMSKRMDETFRLLNRQRKIAAKSVARQ